MEPLKENWSKFRGSMKFYLSYLSISSIMSGIAKAKTMTWMERLVVFLSTMFWIIYGFGFGIIKITCAINNFVLYLMRGELWAVKKKQVEEKVSKRIPIGKWNY